MVGKVYILPHYIYCMTLTVCDAKGRLYLKEELRRRYGNRFIAVAASGEIVLLPVPKDPVKDLQDVAGKAQKLSLKRLKGLIRETALHQVRA